MQSNYYITTLKEGGFNNDPKGIFKNLTLISQISTKRLVIICGIRVKKPCKLEYKCKAIITLPTSKKVVF